MFNEDAVGILAKLDGRGFQRASCLVDLSAELQVCLQAASQTADVINDDNHALTPMLTHECEHSGNTGTAQHGP
nr:hypothetical protein [Novosphingobium naphthalenivorans]